MVSASYSFRARIPLSTGLLNPDWSPPKAVLLLVLVPVDFRMALCKYVHIFKSSSGEERQIWEYLERRGGRVGHPDQLRVVATKLLTVPPALSLALYRVLYEV